MPGPNNEKALLRLLDQRGGIVQHTDADVRAGRPLGVRRAGHQRRTANGCTSTSQAFTQPFQTTTANPRPEHGVLQTAAIGAGGAPGGWTTEYTGPLGDARGSSQGRILYNEFLGDYVYAIATRDYGAGVWTDVRRTADCPALDAWRQQSSTPARLFPAPWPLGDCPADFGNNDIFSATTG